MKSSRSFLLLTTLAFAGWQTQAIAQTTVDLGSAASFAVLAGSAITFTGATTVSGDIGSYPTNAITGVTPTFLSGSNHGNDSFTQTAKSALASAYADAAGRSGTVIGTQLGGTTLTPGVYSAGTFAINGNLTLDGSGVYIFQSAAALDTAISSQVLLTNGAQAGNVFWQVASSATFLSSSVFVGNVLANTSITVGTGSVIDGRVLAMNGAVTFDGGNTVSIPTAIPEPATTAALAAGLMVLVIGVRRIRRPQAAL
jgi:cytoskeletal protein CcmA (bactofilin family)